MMKLLLALSLYIFIFNNLQAQIPARLRSTLAAGGPSTQGESKARLIRSTGQSSIIGSYTNSPLQLRQGFIQPWIQAAPTQEDPLYVDVFPNPFSDALHLRTADNINRLSITLTDMTGRTVYTASDTQTSTIILTQHLAAGMYLLHVRDQMRLFTQKVIKL